MNNTKAAELFEKSPVSQAVLKNALPAMAAMLMEIGRASCRERV